MIVVVLGYFTTQMAVLERVGPFRAFERSSELVQGRWWRTAGTLLLGWLVLFLVFWPVNLAVREIHAGVAYVVLLTLARAIDLSLSALFGTLLYFSLRARRGQPQALAGA